MKVSFFVPSDQEIIATFWLDIFKEMNWPVRQTDGFEDIPAFFHFPEGFLMTIKDNNNIVGCAGVKPLSSTIGIIKRFYISSGFRGKGVSKKLLDEIISEAKNRKFSTLVLDVYFKNSRAKRFYEKHQFRSFKPKPNPGWKESLAPDKFYYYQMDIA